MEKNKIGIFDSGIGGISVLQELITTFPNNDFVYLFDRTGLPYGNKNSDEIIDRVRKNIRFLIDKKASIIVIACNTASCVALDIVSRDFSIPIFGVLPPVDRVVGCGRSKILLLATNLTAKSDMLKTQVDKYCEKIILLPQKDLAYIIEKRFHLKNELYKTLDKRLSVYAGKIDSVILGCTHYCFLKNYFERLFGVEVYDGVCELKEKLNSCNKISKKLINNGKTEFFYV